MARRRTLRPEEEALWRTVARTAQPMHSTPSFDKTEDPTASLRQLLPQPVERSRFGTFRIGEKTTATRTMVPAAPTLRMDAKAFGKMIRGKLAPEARIDLHGMTVSQAHQELIRFLLNAQSSGLRLVLVITGKGKQGADIGPIPQRTGVLRQQLPHWLRQPPLNAAILQVTEAHLRHGGSGAFYVYLRRNR